MSIKPNFHVDILSCVEVEKPMNFHHSYLDSKFDNFDLAFALFKRKCFKNYFQSSYKLILTIIFIV
jgi:hypothetical protein